MATNGFYFFYCISFRTAAGKLACRDVQTLDGATGMSTQANVRECEYLSGLRECDARSNPQLILFGGATDRRHKDLRDKLVAISWRIGEKSSLSDFFEKAFYYGKM